MVLHGDGHVVGPRSAACHVLELHSDVTAIQHVHEPAKGMQSTQLWAARRRDIVSSGNPEHSAVNSVIQAVSDSVNKNERLSLRGGHSTAMCAPGYARLNKDSVDRYR